VEKKCEKNGAARDGERRVNATPALPTVLSAIDACGVVAIVRGAFLDRIDDIVEALVAGGIRAIEVSLTSPDAHAQIARAVKCAGARACIGAGTVLSQDDVRQCRESGAAFSVSPVVDAAVITAALQHDMTPIPGACTPTEALTASRLGAPAIKLFPGDTLGPRFVKGLLVALPHLRLVPTGGVTLELARQFAEAGAWAVGVGSPLVSTPIDPDQLARRARAFVGAMRPSAVR